MKKIAFLLLIGGFLCGAYVAALDEKVVDWMLFSIAAVAAITGVLVSKQADRAHATSVEVLETNRSELIGSIGNVVRDLGEMTDGESLRGEALRHWIDEKLRPDLRRFVEARESMVHLYGLQAYADIMSEFAAGERYINRVWTSSADGYDEEAETYLGKAAQQFKDAQEQLSRAAA